MNGQMEHKKTSETITNFLETKRTNAGHSTHVSMTHPRGKFRLERRDFDTLFEMMKDNIPESLGLAESPVGDILPILVDVDLKVKEDDVSGIMDADPVRYLYDKEQLEELVSTYQKVLRSICDENMDEKNLACVVLEKPMYKQVLGEISYVKNGFHLHFPFLFLSKKYIRVHLIPRIKTWLDERSLFEDIGLTDSESIIDDAVVVNAWLMYGCKKEGVNMTAYKATCVYDHTGKCMSPEEAFDGYEIFNCREDPIELTRSNVIQNLPRILSIRVNNRSVTDIRTNLQPPACLRDEIPDIVDMSNSHTDMFSNPAKDLETAKSIIKFLDTRRAENYSDWMKVGWILYNISGGSREGFEIWDEFSKRSSKYCDAEVLDKWNNSMRRREVPGLGSLIFFAKADDPEGFQKWKKNNSEQQVMDAVNTGGTHNDIARMIFEMYRTKFRCASVSGKKWYVFADHAWEEMEEGTYLRAKISDSEDGLVSIFEASISKQRAILASESDEAAKLMHNSRIKSMNKIILQLKDARYKNNIMRECAEVFYDKKFLKNLDKDRMKVAFENGVYDLEENIFRDGLPEDYISTKMPVAYRVFKRTDEAVKQLELYLEQVFPDPTVRKYFLDVYSEIFEGGNSRKIVLIWTGDGDNGKSITQKLLEKLLGKLAIKFSTTLLSGSKTKMGNAAPEMARAKPPVRHATMDEPDNDEKLNCGLMKQLSGGDSYWARDLFQKGSDTMEVTPMFTLTLLCNSLPRLRHPDRATWNRIRVIPFESTFVDRDKPCPETYEEQLKQKRFPKDLNFSDKIPGMLEALAWYLLEHRAGWPDDEGNRTEFPGADPPKVKNATLAYERENDAVREFLSSEYQESEESSIRSDTLWESWKEWWKINHAGPSEMPVREASDFSRKVSMIWGKPRSLGAICEWRGYKARPLVQLDDQEESTRDLMMG